MQSSETLGLYVRHQSLLSRLSLQPLHVSQSTECTLSWRRVENPEVEGERARKRSQLGSRPYVRFLGLRKPILLFFLSSRSHFLIFFVCPYILILVIDLWHLGSHKTSSLPSCSVFVQSVAPYRETRMPVMLAVPRVLKAHVCQWPQPSTWGSIRHGFWGLVWFGFSNSSFKRVNSYQAVLDMQTWVWNAGQPWANYLISLSLRFLVYRRG